MINRVDNLSMMKCLLQCGDLLKQVTHPRVAILPDWCSKAQATI